MLLGTIPYLDGVVILAILISVTIDLDPIQPFTRQSGALRPMIFSGSDTAILINTLGIVANSSILMDDHPLTYQWRSPVVIVVSGILPQWVPSLSLPYSFQRFRC